MSVTFHNPCVSWDAGSGFWAANFQQIPKHPGFATVLYPVVFGVWVHRHALSWPLVYFVSQVFCAWESRVEFSLGVLLNNPRCGYLHGSPESLGWKSDLWNMGSYLR